MIEMYKNTHGYFEDNCVKHLFEMKSTNTRGRQYATKIRHTNTTARRNYLAFSVASIWNSLFSNIFKLVSWNIFKNKLGHRCLPRNIDFDPNYDFLNTYAIGILLKWHFAIVSFNFKFIYFCFLIYFIIGISCVNFSTSISVWY